MTKLIPAAAVQTGDTLVVFGKPFVVRKVRRDGDKVSFWFVGVESKPQVAPADLDVRVEG